MARPRRPRLDLLKLAKDNPHLTAEQMAKQLGMKPHTVATHLHRCGFFKVWQKVQMPTSEGVRIGNA